MRQNPLRVDTYPLSFLQDGVHSNKHTNKQKKSIFVNLAAYATEHSHLWCQKNECFRLRPIDRTDFTSTVRTPTITALYFELLSVVTPYSRVYEIFL